MIIKKDFIIQKVLCLIHHIYCLVKIVIPSLIENLFGGYINEGEKVNLY